MHKILLVLVALISTLLFGNPTYISDEALVDDKYAASSFEALVDDKYAASSFNENLDNFILNSKNVGGKYINSKLINASLIKVDDLIYIKADYDVSVQYIYSNAKMMGSKNVSLLHPVIIDNNEFTLPNINEYLQLTKIIHENEDLNFTKIRDINVAEKIDNEILKNFNKTVDLALENFNKNIEKEEVESSDELKYFPYIEFDDMGYAYIKGTKEKLTSDMNPIIIYDPTENLSIVEYVDFIDGRSISKVTKIKKGKNLNLEDLAVKDGSEYIKHLISTDIKLGVKYLNERTIAEIIFKDGKMVECKILP